MIPSLNEAEVWTLKKLSYPWENHSVNRWSEVFVNHKSEFLKELWIIEAKTTGIMNIKVEMIPLLPPILVIPTIDGQLHNNLHLSQQS